MKKLLFMGLFVTSITIAAMNEQPLITPDQNIVVELVNTFKSKEFRNDLNKVFIQHGKKIAQKLSESDKERAKDLLQALIDQLSIDWQAAQKGLTRENPTSLVYDAAMNTMKESEEVVQPFSYALYEATGKEPGSISKMLQDFVLIFANSAQKILKDKPKEKISLKNN